MVIGLINGVAKTLTLANAGHHAHPLLVRDGTHKPLISKGMPLGMMAGISCLFGSSRWVFLCGVMAELLKCRRRSNPSLLRQESPE